MVAAFGSADQSYLRMAGSGHFHNNAFRSFSSSGFISSLNTPAGLNGHGFPPSGILQLGQSQNLNNSSNDQLKFQSAITPVNQNVLHGTPMSIGFDHSQNSKGVLSVQNLTTDDVKTTFPIPDQRLRLATSSSYPPSLGITNNASSSSGASRHSEFPFSMIDQSRHSDNWSSAVQLSGIQTNSFPSSECFRQTAIPPSDNMASLPLQGAYLSGQSIASLCSQSHGSLADMHSQGAFFTNPPEYGNSNLPFQGWEDHNQDAIYHSNVTCGSTNSPFSGAVVPSGLTTTNSALHRNLDTRFCDDPIQMKHAGFGELVECSSSRQPRANVVSQQKFSNNLGSLEYLVSSTMEQVITFGMTSVIYLLQPNPTCLTLLSYFEVLIQLSTYLVIYLLYSFCLYTITDILHKVDT